MSSAAQPAVSRSCKACGKQLLFAVNQRTGKTVPLDVRSRAYLFELVDSNENGNTCEPVADREIFIAHVLTCPSVFAKKAVTP